MVGIACKLLKISEMIMITFRNWERTFPRIYFIVSLGNFKRLPFQPYLSKQLSQTWQTYINFDIDTFDLSPSILKWLI